MQKKWIGITILVTLMTGCSSQQDEKGVEVWQQELANLIEEVNQLEAFESETTVGFIIDTDAQDITTGYRQVLDSVSSYQLQVDSQVNRKTGDSVWQIDIFDGTTSHPFFDMQSDATSTYVNVGKIYTGLDDIFKISEMDSMMGYILGMLFEGVDYIEVSGSIGALMDVEALQQQVWGTSALEMAEFNEIVLAEYEQLLADILEKDGDVYRVHMTDAHLLGLLEIAAEYILEHPELMISMQDELSYALGDIYGITEQEYLEMVEALKEDDNLKEEFGQEVKNIINELGHVIEGSYMTYEISKNNDSYQSMTEMMLCLKEDTETMQVGVVIEENTKAIEQVELMDLNGQTIINLEDWLRW